MTAPSAALPRPAARRPRPRLLPWAPLLTVGVLAGPVAAGVAGTLAPAFGWFPPLGGTSLSLEPWRELLAWPGFAAALRVSATTGLLSTALSLGIALLICAGWQGAPSFRLVRRTLAPLLSAPHAAAAFGLAFLIAPSGWIARALSPWATGWETPPDWLIVGDPAGLALVAGLVVKEVPFLLLMILAALPQADADSGRLVARSLGYGRVVGWMKVVAPRVYPQIRLPVYAVLAYSTTVVDVAAILGPTTPPTLALQVTEWARDPDLALRFRAAAGATLTLALTLALIGLWRGTELAALALGRRWIEAGGRGARDGVARIAALALAALCVGAVGLGLAGLAVWSMAGLWIFPDALPDGLSLRTWERAADGLAAASWETAVIAGVAALGALFLAIACLEAETRHGLRMTPRSLWLLYLPLVAPQVAFLTGLQTFALGLGLDGDRWAVAAAHLVFVTPYVFLSLAEPWRALDPRLTLAAAALGAGVERRLWAVRLPMLLRPLLTAAAVGFAVSVGLYLPTLLIGGGRVETLTTEAVALAAGGDRRVIGAYALAQAALPFLGFALALAVPAAAFRRRRALRP